MAIKSRTEPLLELRRLINGYQVTQALYVLVVLEIPDRLAERPRTAEELAKESGAAAGPLFTLLRAVATLGVLEELPDRRFQLTELGQGLRSDAPRSLAGWTAFIGSPMHWRTWGRLLDTVRTGEQGFRLEHGTDPWTYRREHPEEVAVFNRAMNSASGVVAEAVVDAYDFSRFGTVVDVGGGGGRLLAEILSRHPGVKGVLFDLPHVVADSRAFIEQSGLADRCRLEGGSFFEKAPADGDAYVLKSVLHDWYDEDALRILKTCLTAMREDALLLVVEGLVGPPNEGREVKFGDLNMMVAAGGQERTAEEWEVLFRAAGFELRRIVPAAGRAVLEAAPQNQPRPRKRS